MGPNARLEVSGSFHVGTADFLRIADGATFHADPAQGSVLTVARPEAFGFLGTTPATISIRESTLKVPEGQTLSSIGGDVHLAGGMLVAPGGTVTLAAMQAPGEMSLAGEATGSSACGHLHLSDRAQADVCGEAVGGIYLVGGHIEVTAAEVVATTGVRDGRSIRVEADILLLADGARLQGSTAGGGAAGADHWGT